MEMINCEHELLASDINDVEPPLCKKILVIMLLTNGQQESYYVSFLLETSGQTSPHYLRC